MINLIPTQRRIAEIGRIRMGEKGDKGQPVRLEHWRLTSKSADLLASAAGIYGGEVSEWPAEGGYQLTTNTAELDVALPPQADAYSVRAEKWARSKSGNSMCVAWSDDGYTVSEVDIDSGELVEREATEKDLADMSVTLRVNLLLPRVAGIGVWRLDTKSKIALSEMPGSLDLLAKFALEGQMIPAVLMIEHGESRTPGQKRKFGYPQLVVRESIEALTNGLALEGPGPLVGIEAPDLEELARELTQGMTRAQKAELKRELAISNIAMDDLADEEKMAEARRLRVGVMAANGSGANAAPEGGGQAETPDAGGVPFVADQQSASGDAGGTAPAPVQGVLEEARAAHERKKGTK